MANVSVRGIIKRIFDAEIRGNFEKRVFWVEEVGVQYPQFYQLELQQGDCNKLDNFRVGQEVVCTFDLRGRYWEKDGKEAVFHTLKCWKIMLPGFTEPVQQQQVPAAPQPKIQEPAFSYPEVQDDLPF